MKSAYSYPDLYYIGNSKDAYRLWRKFSITKFYPANNYKPIEEQPINERAKKILLQGHDLQLKHSPVCSIGWSDKDQKWYGWSHRAIYGFRPGDKVKKGDCGYVPDNRENDIEDFLRFWDFDKDGNWVKPSHYTEEDNVTHCVMTKMKKDVLDPGGGISGLGIFIEYDTYVKDDRGVLHNKHFYPYLQEYGHGEWEAKTWDDAKQMAIDFANGVS
jgi:hypothetical protein